MKTILKSQETDGQKDRSWNGQTELNNMLVKGSVLNEINKVGTFTQNFKK